MFTAGKLNVTKKAATTTTICHEAHIPQSKVGQVAHVLPSLWVTLQEVDISQCALETACWLQLGCWSSNVVNSLLSPGPFNHRILCSCLVSQCSQLPDWPRHRWWRWLTLQTPVVWKLKQPSYILPTVDGGFAYSYARIFLSAE